MPCFHPVDIWIHRTKKTPNGKKLVVHSLPLTDRDFEKSQRKCGQCTGCLLARSGEWALRCMHEASLYKNNCFITLTYNDHHLPKNNTLVLSHMQDFLKRLRKKYGPNIRVYYCGEYGDQYGRPHYHALLFNHDFSDKTFWSTRNKLPVFRSPSLEKLWTFGNSEIGTLTFESAAYVARYCLQKLTTPHKRSSAAQIAAYDAKYQRIDPDTGEVTYALEEFTHMSLKPGIANAWFKTYQQDVFPSDFIIYKGRKLKPPKYYMGQYELTGDLMVDQVKHARYLQSLETLDNNTPARLNVREQVQLAKLKLLPRNL